MKSYMCITGAAGGLGKAFSAECASRGWDLIITDIHTQPLESLALGLSRQYDINVISIPCDLTNSLEREAFWDQVWKNKYYLHGLINVAGLDHEGLFNERHIDDLRTILRVNIEAAVEMTHAALAYRRPDKRMTIINVSSLASFYPMPVKAVYAASKRFLLDFSLALRQELYPAGINITALCPAGLPTTNACIEKINVQGWMGRITTMNVGDVAAQTIDAALAGRAIFIPGAVNHFLRFLGGLVPPTLIAAFIGKRWMNAHAKTRRIKRQAQQTAAALDVSSISI
jgi:short-subunit dehydrogenase